MAFPILGSPNPQFSDSSGSPYASGTLSVLDPADDTNKASYPTYDDAEALTNANANPITLDARGSCTLWGLDNEDYKLVLKDSDGGTVWTTDDVFLPNFGQYYAVTAAETSAGVTPTNYQYEPGNVLRYGADPSASAATNTTAFQSAISAAETTDFTSPKVYIPAGNYAVNDGVFTYGSSATGIQFEGDGWTSTTLTLQVDGTNQVYFYNNTGAQSYRNRFIGLRFKGANVLYCNFMKLNDTVAYEKKPACEACRFEDINTVLTTTGTTTADQSTFMNCEWNNVTTLLDLDNGQSMLHNFINCVGTVTGDVWIVRANGGGECHYYGGDIIHEPSTSDKYLIKGIGDPAVGVTTGQFSFNMTRFEHRSQYAKLVNWPTTTATSSQRPVSINFNTMNLAVLNSGSGATRTDAVLIGGSKTVTFDNCVLPLVAAGTNDDWGFTIDCPDSSAAIFSNPGTINFRNCTVPHNLGSKCSITNRHGRFNATGCTANDAYSDALRTAVNFSKGHEQTLAGGAHAPIKTLFLKRYNWPYSDGAGGFNSESTAILPAGAILTRAVIYLPAQGSDTDTVQYHIGSDDKGTQYVSTTSAAQNTLHAATAQLNIAQFSAETTIRLYMTETTPSTGTQQNTGGYAYVEYI